MKPVIPIQYLALATLVVAVSANAGDQSTQGTWKPFNPTSDELKAAKAVPYFKDGEFAGYMLIAVRPGSKFQKVGLQSGDVIQTADGRPITEPSKP